MSNITFRNILEVKYLNIFPFHKNIPLKYKNRLNNFLVGYAISSTPLKRPVLRKVSKLLNKYSIVLFNTSPMIKHLFRACQVFS